MLDAITAQRVDLAPIEDHLLRLAERVETSTPDLTPLQTALDAVARHQAAQDRELEARFDQLGTAIADNRPDLQPVLDAVSDNRPDLQPVLDAITDNRPDLQPVLDAITASRPDLQPVLEAITSQQPDLSTVESALAELARTVEVSRPDLDPVRESLGRLHDLVAEKEPDLGPVRSELREVRTAIAASAEPVDPLRDDIAALADRLAAARDDLAPLRQELGELRRDVAHHRPDLSSIEASLTTILDALAEGITENRNGRQQVIETVDHVRQLLPDPKATERLADAVAQVSQAVSDAGARAVHPDAVATIAARLEAVHSTIDSLGLDERLRETELHLGRRLDVNADSVRSRIDDQQALTDALAANVSQLNAALTLASEAPQQLRRDLDRVLEQLAERVGSAMHELRIELRGRGPEPIALHSSVEAGLDRISGRFQNDAGRILQAVSAAQEDTDGRLRRIDAQVTELRRTVERSRRRLEPVDAG